MATNSKRQLCNVASNLYMIDTDEKHDAKWFEDYAPQGYYSDIYRNRQLCSQAFLKKIARTLFEARDKRYLAISILPKGDTWEGVTIESWTSDGEGKNANVGFVMGHSRYSCKLDEITAIHVLH